MSQESDLTIKQVLVNYEGQCFRGISANPGDELSYVAEDADIILSKANINPLIVVEASDGKKYAGEYYFKFSEIDDELAAQYMQDYGDDEDEDDQDEDQAGSDSP